MARYIDADALVQDIETQLNFLQTAIPDEKMNEICNIVRTNFISEINLMPTADVVEVVHGKNIGGGAFECSVCGFRDNYHDYEVHYCPNCGAKMEKEND